MSSFDTSEPNPNQDPQQRLSAIPPIIVGGRTVEPTEIFDHVNSYLFKSGQSSEYAALIGNTDEARLAVETGLVNSLEEASQSGDNSDKPRNIIHPLPAYFDNPDPAISDVMRNRTDRLESLLVVSELNEAINKSHGGFIQTETAIEHPEFSWARVSADNHTILTIRYELFKDKPEQDKRTLADDITTIHLGYARQGRENNQEESNHLPPLISMRFQEEREANDYEPNLSVEIPAEKEELLSYLTKKLVTEALVDKYKRELNLSEHARQLIGKWASEIVEANPDPVQAREELEKIGIFDDPSIYRKSDN